jgi:hypothetical protein
MYHGPVEQRTFTERVPPAAVSVMSMPRGPAIRLG